MKYIKHKRKGDPSIPGNIHFCLLPYLGGLSKFFMGFNDSLALGDQNVTRILCLCCFALESPITTISFNSLYKISKIRYFVITTRMTFGA